MTARGRKCPPQDDSREAGDLSPKQEIVLSALLRGEDHSSAAVTAGCSSRTVRRWLHGDAAFRAALDHGQRELQEAVLLGLKHLGRKAVRALDSILTSTDRADPGRVRAALGTLTLLLRDRDDADDDEPVAVAEDLETVSAERADALLEELLAAYSPENGSGATQEPGGVDVAPQPLPGQGGPVPAPRRPRPRLVPRLPLDPTDFSDLGRIRPAPDDDDDFGTEKVR